MRLATYDNPATTYQVVYMTKLQAHLFLALLLFGVILIPLLLSLEGHIIAAGVIFCIALIAFFKLPPDKILPPKRKNKP